GTDRPAGAVMVVEDLACFVHVQGTCVAGGIAAVPVVDAVRDVARLLQLVDHDTRSDGMHGAGGDVDYVTWAHRQGTQDLVEPARGHELDVLVRATVTGEAIGERGSGRGVEDVPAL